MRRTRAQPTLSAPIASPSHLPAVAGPNGTMHRSDGGVFTYFDGMRSIGEEGSDAEIRMWSACRP